MSLSSWLSFLGLTERMAELVHPADPAEIGAVALDVVIDLIGRGEEGGNNRGSLLTLLGGRQGDLWCALLAGYGYRRVYAELDAPAPGWLFRRHGVPEPGAKRLVTALGKVGSTFRDPALAIAGDLVLWSRTGGGHVGIVEHVDAHVVHSVEGNVGAYPAPVRRMTHDVRIEPHFQMFATLRDQTTIIS